jgi:hypothetical protein
MKRKLIASFVAICGIAGLVLTLFVAPIDKAYACDQSSQIMPGDNAGVNNTCDQTDSGTSDASSEASPTAHSRKSSRTSTGSRPAAKKTKTPQQIYDEKVAAIKKKNTALVDRYKAQIDQINKMMGDGTCAVSGSSNGTGNSCPTATAPDLTKLPDPPKGAKPPTQPLLPPEEAAYLAIATKLQINASGVGIGPDPDLSKWNMAVVGHSYWLWATGPTHLGPVSDSASGRTVTLEANLTKVTFDMGDGNTVTCNGPGTPYPGDKDGLYSKSPTCGYTYATTSRHHAGGTYPVRATTYWSVAYTAPDGAGTIPIVLATQRNLKVGELQTVITH